MQWSWMLTFNYVDSSSHQTKFKGICSRRGKQKEDVETYWVGGHVEAMKMGTDKPRARFLAVVLPIGFVKKAP